jgi:integrase
MRAGGIAALRWDDVDVERGIIVVHQAVDRDAPRGKAKATKTDEERRVLVEPALRPMIRALLEGGSAALVFPKMPPRTVATARPRRCAPTSSAPASRERLSSSEPARGSG